MAFSVALLAMTSAPRATLAQGHHLSGIDTDGDGSVSMQEAHDAGANRFDQLDKHHAGKLKMKQISPIHRAMREMASHDKDHTLDKDEYMAGVDAAFKKADATGSGALNGAALKTKAGRDFLALVK